MTPVEINKVEKYLCNMFNNQDITIEAPKKINEPVEIYISDEFIGTVYRDEDEGEVAYSLQIMILEEDLSS